MITYDIKIDYKIILCLAKEPTGILNHSDMRANAHSAPGKLDSHLHNLVCWGMIENIEPKGVGFPRTIILRKDWEDCVKLLDELSEAIDTVNEFFGLTKQNNNEE